MLQTQSTINWIEFDEIAGEVLKEHGFTEDDLENMSVHDVMEKIEELFDVELEEDDDYVLVV